MTTISEMDILKFFQKYIFEWMYSDIENCIKAKANLVVATILMSYTENIGALIEGNLGEERTSEKNFNEFLKYFEFKGDQNYYQNFKIKYQEADSSVIKEANIYKAFRCGLIHEYSPKIPCIIHNNPDRADHFAEEDAGISLVL